MGMERECAGRESARVCGRVRMRVNLASRQGFGQKIRDCLSVVDAVYHSGN